MTCLLFTVLAVLCLGAVHARQSFAQSLLSERVTTVLREKLIIVDTESNGTFVGAGDEDSGWILDLEQSPVHLDQSIIGEVMRHTLQGLTVDENHCWCKGYTCSCCYEFNISKIHLKGNGCLTIAYLVAEVGIQVTLSLDGKVIISQKITAKNPPPICVSLPTLKKLASICLRFTNLDFSNKRFSGCAALEARLLKIAVEKINLGCFKIPPNEMN